MDVLVKFVALGVGNTLGSNLCRWDFDGDAKPRMRLAFSV